MNESAHRELREMLGWYAIGRADESERIRVEAHLDGCPQCREELHELQGTVVGLSLVDADRLDERPAPPPELGDDVVAHVLAARPVPARRRTVPMLLAAAVVALLVGGTVGWLVKPAPAVLAAPLEPVPVQTNDTTVTASADVIPHTWGMEIQLTAQGFVTGRAYEVRVVTDAGDRSPAGEFVGTGTKQMRCNLNSAVLRTDAAGFEVLDDAGSVLLSSSF